MKNIPFIFNGTLIKGGVLTDDPTKSEAKGYEGRYYRSSKDFLAINNLEGVTMLNTVYADRKMLPLRG
jgi:hypothetical protein